jgi:hypothetical protein
MEAPWEGASEAGYRHFDVQRQAAMLFRVMEAFSLRHDDAEIGFHRVHNYANVIPSQTCEGSDTITGRDSRCGAEQATCPVPCIQRAGDGIIMKELQDEHAARLDVIAGILIRSFLGGIALLTVWFFCFVLAGDCIYRLHSRWFAIPRQAFDTLHYALMAATKISLILFFLLPWIAIRLVSKQK